MEHFEEQELYREYWQTLYPGSGHPPPPPPNPHLARRKMRRRMTDLGLFLCGNQLIIIIAAMLLFLLLEPLITGLTGDAATARYLLDETDYYDSFAMIIAVMLAYLPIVYYNRRSGLTLKKQLAPAEVSLGFVVAAFVMVYAANALGYYIYLLLPLDLSSLSLGVTALPTVHFDTGTPFYYVTTVVYAIVVAPIFEELVFRGAVLMNLRRFGDRFAIIAAALLFALMHGNLQQAVHTFLIGLILGYVCVKTNSLRVPIILHALNNLVVMVLYDYLLVHASLIVTTIANVIMTTSIFIAALLLVIVFYRLRWLPRDRRLLGGSPYSAFFSSPPMLAFILYYLIVIFV